MSHILGHNIVGEVDHYITDVNDIPIIASRVVEEVVLEEEYSLVVVA